MYVHIDSYVHNLIEMKSNVFETEAKVFAIYALSEFIYLGHNFIDF